MNKYESAALMARKIMRDGGDSEDLRLAVGKAIASAPSDEDRAYWKSIADQLARGFDVRTKELEQ